MRDGSSVDIRAASLLCVLLTAPARGQLAQDVDIWLKGEDCRKVSVMSVVWDDDDDRTRRLPATRVSDTCHWTAHTDENFDIDLTHFSLRLGLGIRSARTECHGSEPVRADDRLPWRASLHFSCCSSEAARTLTIRTEPGVFVSYLRRVPGNVPGLESDRRAVACVELGSFAATGSIDYVQSPGTETLHLLLGRMEPDPEAVGLQVKRLLQVRTDDGALGPYDVVHVLTQQLVQGNRSAPTTSPNAIDVALMKVKSLQLKKLYVEVK